MTNKSLLFLSLSNIANSPFFSIANSASSKRAFNIYDSKFKFLVSSLLFSKVNYNMEYNIVRTVFIKSADDVIEIQRGVYEKRTFKNELLEQNIGELNIHRCSFIDCRNSKYYGGAIFTVVPLSLECCTFENCLAYDGGSIYVESSFYCSETSFKKSESIERNGVIYANGDHNFELYYTTIVNSFSKTFGVFSKYGENSTSIYDDNFTQNNAANYVATFELAVRESVISRSYIINNGRTWRNSGISICNSGSYDVCNSVFRDLTPKSDELQGSAVWIDGNDVSIEFKACTFLRCSVGQNQRVIYGNKVGKINIDGCCFDLEKNYIYNTEIENVKIVNPDFSCIEINHRIAVFNNRDKGRMYYNDDSINDSMNDKYLDYDEKFAHFASYLYIFILLFLVISIFLLFNKYSYKLLIDKLSKHNLYRNAGIDNIIFGKNL